MVPPIKIPPPYPWPCPPCCVCKGRCYPPVLLYCNHVLCYQCWICNENTAWTSGKCPLCRKRLNTWTRTQSKVEALKQRPPDAPPWPVHLQLWQLMKDQQIYTDTNTQTQHQDMEDSDDFVHRNICAPGELKKEYEAELERVRRERRLSEEKQLEETKKLIEALQREERLAEEEMKKKIEEDEKIARRLAEHSPESSFSIPPPPERSPLKKSKRNPAPPSNGKLTVQQKSPRTNPRRTLDTYFDKNSSGKNSRSVTQKKSPVDRDGSPAPEMLSTTSRCGRFLKKFLTAKLWGNVTDDSSRSALSISHSKTMASKNHSSVTTSADTSLVEYDTASEDSTIKELCYFKPLQPEPITRYNVKSLKCQAKRVSSKKSSPVSTLNNTDESSLLQNLEKLKRTQLRNAMDVSAFVCLLSVPKNFLKTAEIEADLPRNLQSLKIKLDKSPSKQIPPTKNEITPKKAHEKKVMSHSWIKDNSTNRSERRNARIRRSLSFSDEVSENKNLRNKKQSPKKSNGLIAKPQLKLTQNHNGLSLSTRSKRRDSVNAYSGNDCENFSLDKIDSAILEEQKMIEEKIYQEKKDFALAKKLQRQFGGENLVATTGFTVRTAAKRQTTLIELIPSPKKQKK